MKVIKRNGSEVEFDVTKIVNAISCANAEVAEENRLSQAQILTAANNVTAECEACGHAPAVEEIQDMVEDQIMAHGAFEVARKYIIYRYVQNLKRQSNTTDEKIMTLIECNNEEESRKTRTRTLLLTVCSATIWPAKSPATLPCACCFPRTWLKHMKQALSISMTRTTTCNTCTTATW